MPAVIGWLPLLAEGAFWLITAGLVFSCLTDLRYRIVCNEICLMVLVLALTIAALRGMPPASAWLGAGAVFVGVFCLLLSGQMGGGDAKLILALLPSLTSFQMLQFVFAMCVFGGVLALGVLLLARWLRRRPIVALRRAPGAGALGNQFRQWLRHERARLRRARSVPYVPAIAAGWLMAQFN